MEKGFQVGGPRATFVLVICFLLFMVNYMDRQVMAAVLQTMKNDLRLTDFQVGYINTMFYIGVILFCIPVAHWVDKWSRKKMIGIMAVAWSIFTFFTGASSSITQLLISRFGVGSGEAGFAAGGTALVAASYPQEKRAQKIGIFNASMAVGAMIGFVVGGYLCSRYNWRTPFYAFFVPGLILGILAFFMQDYSLKEESADLIPHSFIKNLKLLFSNRSVMLVLAGYALLGVITVSFLTWNTALIMRTYNFNAAKAGLIGGVLCLLTFPAPWIGGLIGDKWQSKAVGGRIKTASVAMLCATVTLWVAYLAVFYAQSFGMMIFGFVMLIIFSFLLVIANPCVMATVQDVVSPKLRGLSVGILYFAGFLVGGISPAGVGALSDLFGGGSIGLALAIDIAAFSGVLAAIIWWKASKYIASDMRKTFENPAA